MCPEDGARLFRVDADADEGDPLLGAVIDERFRIDDLLGAGGMGAVYRATQLSIQREVALKVLRSELGDEEVALERFYREAKVVSELSHPNIVRLVDFGQDRQRDLLYLVMELVRGMDLGDLVQQGRLRANLSLEVIYQVCGALTEPHQRGIVHRDMKPENIIIVPVSDGTLQVKVLDFGIARTLESEETKLTKTGMICGTPWYMSPEQAQNHELDGRTDVYALGVILFEMLTGQPPFAGDTSLQVLLNHIQRPAPNLSEIAPAGMVPAGVSELVAQMLEKSPEDRPASAREVRDRIDDLRRRLNLEPVRLDAEVEDPFEGWILAAMKVENGQWQAAPDSGGEFPEPQTGDSLSRARTDQMAGGEAAVAKERKGTERQYAGADDARGDNGVAQAGPAVRRKTEEVVADDEATAPTATIEAGAERPAAFTEPQHKPGSVDDDIDAGGRSISLILLVGLLGMIVVCSGGGVLTYAVMADRADDEEMTAEAEGGEEQDEGDDEEADDAQAAQADEGDDQGDEEAEGSDESEADGKQEEVAEADEGDERDEEEDASGAPGEDEGEREDEAVAGPDPVEPVPEEDPGEAMEEAIAVDDGDDEARPSDESDERDAPAEETDDGQDDDVVAGEEPDVAEEPDVTEEPDVVEESEESEEEGEAVDDAVEEDESEDEERDALQERLDGLR